MTVIDWLLESDPAIRWQALRDLVGAPSQVVAAERAKVASEGWGARILALQGDDGLWEGGALFPARDGKPLPWTREEGQPWSATAYSLQQLLECGIDPADPRVRLAIEGVVANARWENDNQPYFEGETEPCINGMVVAQGAYFGVDVHPVVERLLGEQMADGGWNCEAGNGSVRGSFHTTIRVLEGLLLHERATGGSEAVTATRRRGETYLLERRLLRRQSTGEVIDPAFLQFSYPARWHFDALRGLDYFRATGDAPDPRLTEAVELVRSKQEPDGTWLLEHSYKGAIPFPLEDGDGRPSRWNTLRALRVLGWFDGASSHGRRP
jgi:hypothetical protein